MLGQIPQKKITTGNFTTYGKIEFEKGTYSSTVPSPSNLFAEATNYKNVRGGGTREMNPSAWEA